MIVDVCHRIILNAISRVLALACIAISLESWRLGIHYAFHLVIIKLG